MIKGCHRQGHSQGLEPRTIIPMEPTHYRGLLAFQNPRSPELLCLISCVLYWVYAAFRADIGLLLVCLRDSPLHLWAQHGTSHAALQVHNPTRRVYDQPQLDCWENPKGERLYFILIQSPSNFVHVRWFVPSRTTLD